MMFRKNRKIFLVFLRVKSYCWCMVIVSSFLTRVWIVQVTKQPADSTILFSIYCLDLYPKQEPKLLMSLQTLVWRRLQCQDVNGTCCGVFICAFLFSKHPQLKQYGLIIIIILLILCRKICQLLQSQVFSCFIYITYRLYIYMCQKARWKSSLWD